MAFPPARKSAELAFKNLAYEKRDFRATVTIRREERLNALDWATLKELSRAFEDAEYDDAVAVVVLTGAGERAFCTGADVKEQADRFLDRPRDYRKWMGAFIEAHDRLRSIGKPTIARLNGMVVGGGNEFNMGCDLAIAADHVTIRQVGPARGSVPAGGATQWLPLIVGDRRAREILWLCEPIDAKTALDWGLVNRVVPASELDAAVDEMVEKLIDKLPGCLRYTKEQTNFWRNFSWGMTVNHAREWLTLNSGSPETRIGMEAFVKKAPIDYRALRTRAAEDDAPEFFHGPPTKSCPRCRAANLPRGHAYCGVCGTKLLARAADLPRDHTP